MFWMFLRLGLTSFGGPMAHIGFFRQAFVEKRAWFNDQQFAQWIALCHALPGPSSSQLGFLIGYQRAGWPGAFAAFLGFTLPSALIMSAVAYGWFAYHQAWSSLIPALLIVAAAVVIQATWGMTKQFCRRAEWALTAISSALVLLAFPSVWTPILLLLGLALLGQWLKTYTSSAPLDLQRTPSRTLGLALLIAPLSLLIILPGLVLVLPELALFDSLYRAGALVFGGGHVVLPYLQIELVQPGLVTESAFLSGYAFAQTLPGPMFSFASYLGALTQGWLGAIVATIAIFLAGLAWIIGVLPFYQQLITNSHFQAGLVAIQAGVVGFLLAALINPILPHAIVSWPSLGLLVLNLLLLWRFKLSVVVLILLNLSVVTLAEWLAPGLVLQ
ncbi:chromate efflux transporter [Thiomicrospira sp.]|uniref:chromate efflux transporter n=1 Tax=Thiomicrospira sp. TaxID=935 RepID=UPI002F91F3D1